MVASALVAGDFCRIIIVVEEYCALSLIFLSFVASAIGSWQSVRFMAIGKSFWSSLFFLYRRGLHHWFLVRFVCRVVPLFAASIYLPLTPRCLTQLTFTPFNFVSLYIASFHRTVTFLCYVLLCLASPFHRSRIISSPVRLNFPVTSSSSTSLTSSNSIVTHLGFHFVSSHILLFHIWPLHLRLNLYYFISPFFLISDIFNWSLPNLTYFLGFAYPYNFTSLFFYSSYQNLTLSRPNLSLTCFTSSSSSTSSSLNLTRSQLRPRSSNLTSAMHTFLTVVLIFTSLSYWSSEGSLLSSSPSLPSSSLSYSR